MTPLAMFEAVWARCEMLAGLHAYIEQNVSSVLQPDELLRAEWISRISALDLYIHELVAQRMVAIFEGRRPATAAYFRFEISIDVVDRLRQASNAVEESAAFDLHVRTQLGQRTYQSPDDIADALRLCSSVELWNEVGLHLGATQTSRSSFVKDLKRKHSIIVRRRNTIAHEGDLQQSPTRDPLSITRADLRDVSTHIESLVRAIDRVS